MKNKITLIAAIAGFLIGVVVIKCTHTSSRSDDLAAEPVTISIKKQEKDVLKKETAFQKKEEVFAKTEKQLYNKLDIAKEEYDRLLKKSRHLQEKIQSLVNNDTITDTNKVVPALQPGIIRDNIKELLTTENDKDSLRDITVEILEKQLSNKDSIIDLKEEQYLSLKTSFDYSMMQQKNLAQQNTRYKKVIKRQKLKQKILSTGIIVLSALLLKNSLHQ